MNSGEKAVEYFSKNFNCSQAVFTTFATKFGIEEDLALKISTQFGGGARKGEMCGAVSGALMALGLKYGHFESHNSQQKTNAYKISEIFMNRFIEQNKTVVCRELLGYDLSIPEDMAIIKDKNLFHTACPQYVYKAAMLVEEIMNEFK